MTSEFIQNENSEKYYPNDWKFDFSALPYWDNRNHIPYVYDKFYPVDKSDALCCIYSIAEVSLCNYIGFLAILKNKNEPYLYLNITDMCFCDNFSSNENGNIIFLEPSVYFEETNKVKRPLLVIDFAKEKYSYIDTDNYNSSYKVVQIDEFIFRIKSDERLKNDRTSDLLCKQNINLRSINWYDLKELNALREMLGATQ